MAYYNTLSAFYNSREWLEFKTALIGQRRASDGFVYCEHCGKPMLKMSDIIPHHYKTFLNIDNVNDAAISLNPDNIQLVHFRCHNEIHNRFGAWTRHIYLVYGSPLSGKSTYVKERAGAHDLIIDIDRIYACITNNPPYIKSNRLYDNMKAVHDSLLDSVKYKRGKWINAFIVQTLPFVGERERLAREYGAELIHIDTDKETCIARLESCPDGRDKDEWRKYIDKYWERYTE